MIEKMLVEIKRYLPLEIKDIEYSNDKLSIYGQNWSFISPSIWRISSHENMVCGCYDSFSDEYIEDLKGFKITDIVFQGKILEIDPVFILSNGKKLEIFSTNISKPWTLEIHDLGSYSATPNEPDSFHKEI